MKNKKTTSDKNYRLFILVKDREIKLPNGKTNIIAKWTEVIEADLGSKKFPNTNILQYKFEPVIIEPEEDKHKHKNPFDDFKGLFGVD